MQVYGNIATALEERTSNQTGKKYYTFRLAENQGKEENRTTTWYDVTAFISELDADLLAKGQFVKISGRLEIQAYMKKNGEPGASAKLLAAKVEPVETKPKDNEKGE